MFRGCLGYRGCTGCMGCRSCAGILPSASGRVPPATFYRRSADNGAFVTPCTALLLVNGGREVASPPAPDNLHLGSVGLALLPPVLVAPCHAGGPRPCPPPGRGRCDWGCARPPPASPLPSVSLFPTASILVGTGVKNNAALPHGLRGSSQVAITTRGRRACQHRGHRLHRDAAAWGRRTGGRGRRRHRASPGASSVPHRSRARAPQRDPAPNLASFSCTEVWRGASAFRSRFCAARNYRAAPFR